MLILRLLFSVALLITMSCGQGTSGDSSPQQNIDNQFTDNIPSYSSIPDATTKNPSPATRFIYPGDSIQDIISAANPDDKLVIMQGIHIQKVKFNDSALYIDKAIDIEIKKGAEIRVEAPLPYTIEPFIITNHSPVAILETDLKLSYSILPKKPVSYLITVKPTGLYWANSTSTIPPTWSGTDIPIFTNTPIQLENGIFITLNRQLPVGATFFIIFEIRPYFAIRIGNGFQDNYISRVNIHGEGIINQNMYRNGIQTSHAKTLSAGIFIHGRVRDSMINGVSIINSQRAVQIYSEHTGSFLYGGGTSAGTSYGSERITINNVLANNCVDGILVGHPEHRGLTRDITISNNIMSIYGIGIEPNYRLKGFTATANIINSKYGNCAIHLWRGPSNGVVNNNIFINQSTVPKECVLVSTLNNWPKSSNIKLSNNLVVSQ